MALLKALCWALIFIIKKTSYFEPLRDVESDFKFVQFFLYTLYDSTTKVNTYFDQFGVYVVLFKCYFVGKPTV